MIKLKHNKASQLFSRLNIFPFKVFLIYLAKMGRTKIKSVANGDRSLTKAIYKQNQTILQNDKAKK